MSDEMEKLIKATEKNADANERIADYMKMAGFVLFYTMMGVVIVLVVGLLFVLFAGTVHDFIMYDVMGYEEPEWINAPSQAYVEPIDDCSYSEDPQLCYQMQRIAENLKVLDEEVP